MSAPFKSFAKGSLLNWLKQWENSKTIRTLLKQTWMLLRAKPAKKFNWLNRTRSLAFTKRTRQRRDRELKEIEQTTCYAAFHLLLSLWRARSPGGSPVIFVPRESPELLQFHQLHVSI